MEKTVIFKIIDDIALITLNRPDRRNSINEDLLVNLYDCIDEVSSSESINSAIITGEGKSFCSGIDLASIATDNLFDPRGDGTDLPDVFNNCKKPIIAAVNGHAITGGFEIALNCDFIIASETASFADTHSKVGIHPGWGMTQLLQQALGIRMAKQLSFTCQFISAEEAKRIGLVNEVVPTESLIDRAVEISKQMNSVNINMRKIVKDLIEFRTGSTFKESYKNERKGFNKFVNKHLKK